MKRRKAKNLTPSHLIASRHLQRCNSINFWPKKTNLKNLAAIENIFNDTTNCTRLGSLGETLTDTTFKH